MSLRIGDIAPDFAAETSMGRISSFHQWKSNAWCILFSHPKDFTPVCTTEIDSVAILEKEWAQRKVKVIGLSVDSVECHKLWMKDIENLTNEIINFPIIADANASISRTYGMLDRESVNTQTVRSIFFIDPQNVIKFILSYPTSVGRNFYEILRAIDAVQLTSNYPVVTPGNWSKGKEVIVHPSISDEEAEKLLPLGFIKVRSYLRITPDPLNEPDYPDTDDIQKNAMSHPHAT